MAAPAALRPDTIAMVPGLRDVLTQAVLSHVDNHPARVGADRRILLPPRQVADAFGVGLHPGGLVAAIAALSHHSTGHGSSWWRTDPTGAQDAVTSSYLADWFIDEPHEHARLQAAPALLRAAHHTTLRRIASTVPVIELATGPDTPRALRAIVTDLAGPG